LDKVFVLWNSGSPYKMLSELTEAEL
jgi:hypothetical protein